MSEPREDQPEPRVVDSLTLRFTGRDSDGTQLNELRAAHVAEVLQGLVGITSDFDKAGVFHEEGASGAEVLVRPAEEGSFIMEVVRVATEYWEVAATAVGVPSMGSIIWWATKSMRAEPENFEHLDNGNVKIQWQDKTVDEVPARAWEELQKRKRRRKKQLREIMAPLSDPRVEALEVADDDQEDVSDSDAAPEVYTLTRADYDAVKPEDEVKETEKVFEVEGQMAAIDFDNPGRWRVSTDAANRAVTVEDEAFLTRVANGLAIRKTDIFRLRIREDRTVVNGRTSTKWVVLKVESHRRSVNDDGDPSDEASPTP